jgi:hypothetical protein
MAEVLIMVSIIFTPLIYILAKDKMNRRRLKKTIIKKSFYKNIHEDCVICLEGMDQGNKKYKLHCNHCYHKECIITWLFEKPTCPLCNLPIQRRKIRGYS